eukprot:g14142.t1
MRSGKRLWEAAKNSKLVKSKLVTGRKQKLRTLADVARAVRIFHACFEELQDEEEVGVDSLSLSAPATVAVPRREDRKEVPPLAAHEDEPGGGIPGLPQRNRHSSASATSHEDEPGGGIPGLPQRNRHSSASATSSAEQKEDEDPPRSASRSFGMSVSVPDEISGHGVPARAASAEMGIGKDTAAGENFAEEEAETASGGRIPGAEDFPLANGSFATKASPRRSVSFSADKDVILVESAVPSGKNMRKVPNRSGVWRATVESPLGGGDATKEGRVGGKTRDAGVAHKAKVAVPKLSGLQAAAGPRSASPSASALTGMVFPTAMQIRQRSQNRVAGTCSQHAESNEHNPKMNARSSGSVSPVPTISIMSAARGVNVPALMPGGDNLARSPRSPAARNRFGEIQSNLQSVGGYSPATARRVEERQLEGPRSPRLFHPVGRAENLRASVYGGKSAVPSPPPSQQQFFSTRPLEQEELLARLGNTTSGIHLAKASHATTFSQDPLGIEQSPDTPRHRYREMLRAQNIFMSSPTA